MRESYLAKIEATLKKNQIPIAFAEIEWWNAGRRAADSLTIEVRTPGDILSWEITPPKDDVAASWTCSHDPNGPNNDRHLIRISQSKLMPGTRCHFLIGFDPDADSLGIVLRPYLSDRRIPAPMRYNPLPRWWGSVAASAYPFSCTSFARLMDASGGSVLHRLVCESSRVLRSSPQIIIPLCVMSRLVDGIGGGPPSWDSGGATRSEAVMHSLPRFDGCSGPDAM